MFSRLLQFRSKKQNSSPELPPPAPEDTPSESYSLIGRTCQFSGDIVTDGLFRVDGSFSGNIKTGGKIMVGQGGELYSEVNAQSVIIAGLVKGNIRASQKVAVLSTGQVIGNISARTLVVEHGGTIDGFLSIEENNDVAS